MCLFLSVLSLSLDFKFEVQITLSAATCPTQLKKNATNTNATCNMQHAETTTITIFDRPLLSAPWDLDLVRAHTVQFYFLHLQTFLFLLRNPM
jgi:hypothetical protein